MPNDIGGRLVQACTRELAGSRTWDIPVTQRQANITPSLPHTLLILATYKQTSKHTHNGIICHLGAKYWQAPRPIPACTLFKGPTANFEKLITFIDYATCFCFIGLPLALNYNRFRGQIFVLWLVTIGQVRTVYNVWAIMG